MLKILIDQNTIIDQLLIANEIVLSRQSSPLLTNVLLKVSDLILTIFSTDQNIGFETEIKIEEGNDGLILVPCEKITNAVRSFTGGVIIIEQIEDSTVKI